VLGFISSRNLKRSFHFLAISRLGGSWSGAEIRNVSDKAKGRALSLVFEAIPWQ
jgi:hypothetical protein